MVDGDVVEPTSRHQEGLVSDVLGDVRPGSPADEADDVSVARLVEAAKPTRAERVACWGAHT